MTARKSGDIDLESPAIRTPLRDLEELSDINYSRSAHGSDGGLSSWWTSGGWLLWERRNVIFKVTIRTIALAIVIAFLIPSKYDSSTNIMPPEAGDRGALLSLLAGKAGGASEGGPSGLASLAGGFLGMNTPGALFVELVHSRTVEDHLIDRFNLQKVYRTRYKQDTRAILAGRTVVEQERKSGIITITVTDNSPQRARDLAQAYVEELDRLLAQVSTSSARRERIFIEQRLTTVKTELDLAEKQFSAFASKNSALDIKEQAKAEVEAAAVLQGQLIAAQSELQGLAAIYTDSNVRVRTLKARVDELKRQLQRISGTDASLAADDSESSQDVYPSIRKLPLLGVEWADLYRRAKIQETIFQLLTQQYELTRIQEAKEIPTIRMIDPPNVPEKKSGPHRLLLILGLTLVSILGTSVWILGTSHWAAIDSRSPGKLLMVTIWGRISQRVQALATRLKLDRIRIGRRSL
jgi:capsule polysaccharide export protein KpsE/RkpR